MNRCVVIHRTGISEVQEVRPEVHRHLRQLNYQRYVLKFVRTVDGRSMSSAVYSMTVPSAWQIADAVKQLWGQARGSAHVFDDEGRPVEEGRAPPGNEPASPTVARVDDAVRDRRYSAASGHRMEVGANDPLLLEQLGRPRGFPVIRMTAVPSRGWVVEVLVQPADGAAQWKEVHVVELSLGSNPEE